MILVIGNEGCSRCEVVKSVLTSKGVEYEYKLLNDFEQEEKSKYIKMAREAKMLAMPLIIKDDKIISLQEV